MELRCDLGKPLEHALNHDSGVQIIDIAVWCGLGRRCFEDAESEAIAVAVGRIVFELELLDEAGLLAFFVPERITEDFWIGREAKTLSEIGRRFKFEHVIP